MFLAANSVGTSFEFAAFGSGPEAKYRRASVCGGPNTCSLEISIELRSTDSPISIKIKPNLVDVLA